MTNVAVMTNKQPVPNWSVGVNVGESVRCNLAMVFIRETTVSGNADLSGPEPASIGAIDFGPEPNSSRNTFSYHKLRHCIMGWV